MPPDNERQPGVLFLDDDTNVLNGIRRQLRKESGKWRMEFLNNPADAMKRLRENQFDVAVLDIQMPLVNGFDILEEINKSGNEEKPEIIILTGLEENELKWRALDMDATDLLRKPVKKEDLLARINNAIRLKSYKDELRTSNRKLKEELVRSHKMEIVGLMASCAAHDFNNVLSVIIGSNRILKHYATEDDTMTANIDRIEKMTAHGKEITSRMLSFVKNNDDAVVTININEILRESLDLIKISIKEGVGIKLENPEKPVFIDGVYTQIFQVIMNLLLNAANAIEKRGWITLRTFEGEVLPEPQGIDGKKFVKIEISDTGNGMPEEIRESLMDEKIAVKKSREGTGLGISIVHYILSLHSGKLLIESREGAGTTFFVYLPQKQ